MAQELQQVGIYAFLIGIIIAILAGIAGGAIAAYSGPVALVLVILGLIVGLLNITDKNISGFLIAAIALMVVGSANLVTIDTIVLGLGTILQAIVTNIVVFVAPAALVVALKAIWNMARGPM
jgi:hypothetical protein